ncbi:salicylaldehyde dehydrogenase [Robbsia andropogonis]|uniref:Salicylaldehyde dehydrogenase n=1 Tax=Robbsia andropogonis TaxID=28092 RepID=A0A0F5JZW6_9BURK|nr:aldehyde dehydrogenase [Robbsia andropogonis]KKB63373.1 salicylaldehyde dehydrogenase [Robbsia andropogonis]
MTDGKMLIGGEWRAATGSATFDRHDPVTGALASRAGAASVDDATAAVAAAHAAFPAWAALAPTERRRKLLQAADLMDARAADFIAMGVAETGATPGWIGFNVMLAANMLREAASMTTQIQGDVIPSDTPGSLAMGLRVPCGVVLGIAPWNAPVILGTRAVAMPLACGNTVVLKASELCPALHLMIGGVLNDAGIGAGVINVITHTAADAPAVVERLIADPRVRRVNFTGSTRVGRIVARLAAEHLKPALLELGGKAPAIVLDDADLDAAVDAIAFGAFFNQGQICMSTERAIVARGVADAFVERLAVKARTLVAGDPRDGHPLGAMVGADAAARAAALVEDATLQGASLPVGCRVDGAIMQPTIVDGVTSSMRLYRDESFAPVVAVLRAEDDEHAITLANDSEFGLSAAVFSRDLARAMRVANRIASGICHINGATVHDEAQMPFGGVKSSGHGRFGSRASVAEFTELRWITVQTSPRHYPV